MKTRDLMTMAWRNLLRRKSRAFLTIFSVVIGIFSIILMLSFGYGIQISQENFLNEMVSFNSITLYPSKDSSGRQGRGKINKKVLDAINKDPRVDVVLGKIALSSRLKTNKKGVEILGGLYGVDFQALGRQGVKLDNGRPLSSLKKNAFFIDSNIRAMDISKISQRSISGAELKDFPWERARFFIPTSMNENPLDEFTGGGSEKVTVSYGGRLDSSSKLGSSAGIPSIYVDLELAETVQKKWDKSSSSGSPLDKIAGLGGLTGGEGPSADNYSEATVIAKSMDDVESLTEDLKTRYNLTVFSMKEGLDQAQQGMLVLQVVLGAIGGVALFVAAIGIANTMLMSIQERTKEIGVMKVIGAQVGDVRKLFLLEAALIGIIGGIIGILVTLLVSSLANHLFINFAISQGANLDLDGGQFLGISYIPVWLPFMAVFFSAIVGLLAGYLPARRATNISAIEAIRTE